MAFDKALPSGMSVASRAPIAQMRNMNRAMNIGTVLDGIVECDIATLAAQAVAEANPFYPVPRILDQEQLEQLYRAVGGLA